MKQQDVEIHRDIWFETLSASIETLFREEINDMMENTKSLRERMWEDMRRYDEAREERFRKEHQQ